METGKVKKLVFITASLITGACVSASGIIGFVGLMVPHLMRKLIGPDHRYLLPASALGGRYSCRCATRRRERLLPRSNCPSE